MDDAETIAINARAYGEWIEVRREPLQSLYPEKGESTAQKNNSKAPCLWLHINVIYSAWRIAGTGWPIGCSVRPCEV